MPNKPKSQGIPLHLTGEWKKQLMVCKLSYQFNLYGCGIKCLKIMLEQVPQYDRLYNKLYVVEVG